MPTVESPRAHPPTALSRLSQYAWLLALLLGFGLVGWSAHVRQQRIAYLTAQPVWSVDLPARDASSGTGYSHGWRPQIVAGRAGTHTRWIIESQAMASTSAWRWRHVDYTNAPAGYDTVRSNPYRWWLLFMAKIDQLSTDGAFAWSIEHGTLYGDVLLQLLLMASAAWFAARTLGSGAGIFLAFGLATIFPLASGFEPGAPDVRSLAWICTLWSVLPLVSVRVSNHRDPRRACLHFGVAGAAGGLGLWIDASTLGAVLGAIVLAAFTERMAFRSATDELPWPKLWRTWAGVGAAVSLVGYLVEYAPGNFAWAVHSNHPTMAVTWLGVGELLALLPARRRWSRVQIVRAAVALLATAAFPIALRLTANSQLLAADPLASRLANGREPIEAASLAAWLRMAGLDRFALATLAPVVLLTALVLALVLRRGRLGGALLFCLGPLAIAVPFACAQLRWWSAVDLVLLVCGAVILSRAALQSSTPFGPRAASVVAALSLLPGLLIGVSQWRRAANEPLNSRETQQLVERDLAYWLSSRAAPGSTPTVLAPPLLSESLNYFAGIKTIGTVDPENEAGFAAAVRMASATTFSEATVLLDAHRVTEVVLPSWDPGLDELCRIGHRLPPDAELPPLSFAASWRDWRLPAWAKPLPYFMAKAEGISGLSVAVFRIVPEEDPAAATSRLVNYFVDQDLVEQALRFRAQLKLYPRNLAALIAQARVAGATGETAAFDELVTKIRAALGRRSAQALPVEQRINLAVVLTQARASELVQEQVRLALAALTETTLRELGAAEVVRLLVLAKHYNVPFPDESLRLHAMDLLPPLLREQVQSVTKPGATP